MNKIIVVVGPTSSNKSLIALEINKHFKTPIINADAFQVYKELNCGTNKLSKEIITKTPIYLMDNLSIYDKWDITVFQQQAKKLINNFHQQKIVPTLVGGSNLYVDALIKNYDLSSTNARSNLFEDLTNEQLHAKLTGLDKDEANKIPVNNRKRLIRALQIINDANKTKTIKDIQKNDLFYKCLIIYPNIKREDLYKKIDDNVIKMINSGWKQEVQDLITKDPDVINLNAFKALGYKQVHQAIIEDKPIDIATIQQKSRQYAKRQMTWCRHQYKDLLIFENNWSELLKKVEEFIND